MLLGAALVFAALGSAVALWWAPAEAYMGEVYRILYVHVPCAWMALLAYTLNFGASVAYLWKGRAGADALAESVAETGLLFNGLLLLTGSLWAKPTWGVWWEWDPRLTSAAILFVAYSGYLSLRRFVPDPERRAVWSAVAAVLIAVDIPIVYMSVKWWNSLHQVQSSPKTMSADMVVALRLNAFAFLSVLVMLTRMRFHEALHARAAELCEPPSA
jgi:heme exporter protein C